MASKGSVYEGKSYEEAVAKGLEDLGLTRAEAIVTTVEEGKSGFLGIGSRPFRVSVARRPGGAIREPEDGGDRRRARGGREERPARGGRGGRDERPARGGRGGREERGGRAGRDGRPGREERPAQAVTAQAPRSDERRDGRRDGRRDERREGGRDERREGAREERRVGARDERREGARDERRGVSRSEERREGGREPRPDGRRDEPREGRREERREPQREELAREAARPLAEETELRAGDDLAPAGPASAGPEEMSADDRRRRRRRGRRGGRGRRRDGAPANEAHATNGSAPIVDEFSDEPELADDEMTPVASAPAPPPMAPEPAMVAPAPAPVPSPAASPVASARPYRESQPEADDRAPYFSESELAETSRKLTADLLSAMGFEATVVVNVQGTRADVTAEVAQDDDLLNGRKGEVRQALQHLLNRFLNRGEGSRYHLQLEINDFWKRREQELEDLARSLADEAVNTRSEVVTEYLNSQERRIVHVTLKEDARVRTYALGTGMIKRVAVAPADFPERTGDEEA